MITHNKKARELSNFYNKLAETEGGVIKFRKTTDGLWLNTINKYPDLNSNLDDWQVCKPTEKAIDLSICIKSGLDMEFSNNREVWLVGELDVNRGNQDTYNRVDDIYIEWAYCRVRQNHTHAWLGGECPIPEGLEGYAVLRKGTKVNISDIRTWDHEGIGYDIMSFDVIYFVITGTKEGYEYK